ncbi:MAG: hypothetical protein HQM04_17805 [Magnetococcales bacterium]|nr:hypothetical protein [Magnetococcales bacterium]MBF0116885.1 hypothetical protein [Magnetococcales bacterium]
MNETIELKVDYHPCGSRTLKTRSNGQGPWVDLSHDSKLQANKDKCLFYRLVAKYLAELSGQGIIVSQYRDTDQDWLSLCNNKKN